MMNYTFDVDYAIKYGVEESIVISNFQYWISKNLANGVHLHDGHTWTYNSIDAFRKLFPFWTDKQIRRILQSLKDQKILITGNYNKSAYDRTLWYAFEDESVFLFGNIHLPKRENGDAKTGECHLPEQENGNDQTGGPIPNNKPDGKPNENTNSKPGNEETPESETMAQAKKLASILIFEHRKHDPKFKIGTGQEAKSIKIWSKEIEKLISADKQSFIDVLRVILWIESGTTDQSRFWIPNILSGDKLRTKFPTLFLQMKNDRKYVENRQKVAGYVKDPENATAGHPDAPAAAYLELTDAENEAIF